MKMKIYRVDVSLPGSPGWIYRLVRASSLAQARGHVLRIVVARVATPEDVAELLIGEDAIEIEEAGVYVES